MKKALYHALLGSHGHISIGRGTDCYMAVTTEKEGRRGQVYGRDRHGIPTHACATDVLHKFDTEEKAVGAITLARTVSAGHQPAIDEAERKLHDLQSAQRAAIKAALTEAAK